ncbi:MAG: glycosyltransferase family 4 protein [Candidatus Zixiibacteriota bacterium]
MKTAIVHDWLITFGGAERLLEQILRLFPDADLFSLFDFVPPDKRGFILNKPVTTSFLQKFPKAKVKYRSYLPLMPLAIEQFDLSPYDLVISSSYAVAKGVITGPNQLHICVCCSPIRYAWDLTHQYLKESDLTSGFRSWLARFILHKIRMWDVRTANGVDEFVAISQHIARRIQKVYRRRSTVIYPPVDVTGFQLNTHKEDFYLTVSRMVPYKKVDLIVEAFSSMPDRELIVIGDGPGFEKAKQKAGSNVTLLGFQPTEIVKRYMQRARAFIFAAEEDFGIVPVEAQACGTPVIAYGKGGSLETIVDGVTGVLFYEQTPQALTAAVREFERQRLQYVPEAIRNYALRFSTENFRERFQAFVAETWRKHLRRRRVDASRRVSLVRGTEIATPAFANKNSGRKRSILDAAVPSPAEAQSVEK